MVSDTTYYDPGRILEAEPSTKKHNYGTLDNVPEFATRSLGQLYSVCFGRFEQYDGVIIYGPRSRDWPNNGYWGRKMVMHTQEHLQLRFWPKTLLSEPDKDPPLIRFATKVTGPDGNSMCCIYTAFQKTSFQNEKEEFRIDALETMTRIVGCQGLHIFMASLFKRHNLPQTVNSLAASGVSYDRYGYEALRATSYSIHKADKKQLEKTTDHAGACAVTPGVSMLMIAGELVNVHLEPVPGRVCQPISQKKWKENAQFIKQEILHNPRGETAGIQAVAAAQCIVNMLSAEGLVDLHAGSFFEGALPDRLAGPHGMPLTVSMAVNFAIHWGTYGLPRPSMADQHANEQLRMILQTSGYGPLPSIEGTHWCVDVVVRGALRASLPEVEALKRERGLAPNAKLSVMDDTKCFWQRVGQRVITHFFGLGSVLPRNGGNMSSEGTPWRIRDPLQAARDKYQALNGCMFEGMWEPLVEPPASFGERKAAFVKMLTDVEQWLRLGEYQHMMLGQEVVASSEQHEEHMANIKGVLGDLMAPKMVQDLVKKIGMGGAPSPTGETPYDQSVADAMTGNFHLPSMGAAITDCKAALLHGPAHHFKYMTGAYVSAGTQTNSCCDCLAPVHVLQGVMMANAYAECTACHSKRCIPCTDAYAKAVRVDKSQYVGKRCQWCGAEPAYVSVEKTSDGAGGEMMQIHLGERTPAHQDTGPIISEARVRRHVPSNPTHVHAPPKSGKKKKGDKSNRQADTAGEPPSPA
jgi:hypothetical protein